MISNYLKNICLISFALFAPIYLPAGGIQRNLSEKPDNYSYENEIVLNSECFIYSVPVKNSQKLMSIEAGTTLSVLQYWVNSDQNSWIRVKISRNIFVDNPHLPSRGWIRL